MYAIVTGASKGIGKSIVEELARQKQNILLVARSEELLSNLATEIANKYKVKTDFLAIDISLPDASQQLLNWCIAKGYTVNILVNNAGYGLAGRFDEMSLADQTNMMQLNMNTLVTTCYVFLPMLQQQKKSYILNIASTTAYQAMPGFAVYAASKAFVLSFSRALHHELAHSKVSVTCLSPGATDTAFVERANMSEAILKAAKKVNMTPQEVAKIGVKAMFAEKNEAIAGAINQASSYLTYILPKNLFEKVAEKIYLGK